MDYDRYLKGATSESGEHLKAVGDALSSAPLAVVWCCPQFIAEAIGFKRLVAVCLDGGV